MSRHHHTHAKPQPTHHAIAIDAPEAQSVEVTGNFCDWERGRHPLRRDANGTWKAVLTLSPGRYEYRLLVDGRWQDDPTCHDRVPNPFGTENCVFTA